MRERNFAASRDFADCSLIMRRFSSSTLTGTRRREVAVGTVRLVSIFSTIFFDAPVIALTSTFAPTVTLGVVFAAGAVVAGAVCVAAPFDFGVSVLACSPVQSPSVRCCHLPSVRCRSANRRNMCATIRQPDSGLIGNDLTNLPHKKHSRRSFRQYIQINSLLFHSLFMTSFNIRGTIKTILAHPKLKHKYAVLEKSVSARRAKI